MLTTRRACHHMMIKRPPCGCTHTASPASIILETGGPSNPFHLTTPFTRDMQSGAKLTQIHKSINSDFLARPQEQEPKMLACCHRLQVRIIHTRVASQAEGLNVWKHIQQGGQLAGCDNSHARQCINGRLQTRVTLPLVASDVKTCPPDLWNCYSVQQHSEVCSIGTVLSSRAFQVQLDLRSLVKHVQATQCRGGAKQICNLVHFRCPIFGLPCTGQGF